ncbi:MAG: hypothetical protein ACYDGY_07620 [Acidimicrobiales bacterium]
MRWRTARRLRRIGVVSGAVVILVGVGWWVVLATSVNSSHVPSLLPGKTDQVNTKLAFGSLKLLAAAKASSLRSSDFPPGWKGTQAYPEQSFSYVLSTVQDGRTVEQSFAHCMNVSGSEAVALLDGSGSPKVLAIATSPNFVPLKAANLEASSVVQIYQSSSDATGAVRMLQGPSYRRCSPSVWAAVLTGAPSNSGPGMSNTHVTTAPPRVLGVTITPGTSSLPKMPRGISVGADTIVVHFEMAVGTEVGFAVKDVLSRVVLTAGRAEVSILLSSFGSSPPVSLRNHLVEVEANRLHRLFN